MLTFDVSQRTQAMRLAKTNTKIGKEAEKGLLFVDNTVPIMAVPPRIFSETVAD